jgi:predicted flap endonuclease-1-like 5' DNA nuclease
VLSVRDVGRLIGGALEDGKVSYTERKDLEKLTTEFSNELSPAARSAINRFLAMGDVFDGNTAGKIFGLDLAKADKLEKAGVRTVSDLMITSKTPQGRDRLAADSNINLSQITTFAERADLSRVMGIGNKYAAILHGVGINNMRELGEEKPAELHDKIIAFMRTDDGKAITRRRPNLDKVTDWVDRAKLLPDLMQYLGDTGTNFTRAAFDNLTDNQKFTLLIGYDVRLSDVSIFEAETLRSAVPRRKPRAVTELIQRLERNGFNGEYDSCHLSSIQRLKADDDTLGFRIVFDVSGSEEFWAEGMRGSEGLEGVVTLAVDSDGKIFGTDYDVWPNGDYE